MKIVSTPGAPTPGGHYSQAVVHGDTVSVSGQFPVDPRTGERRLGSIEEQTELVLQNLGAILEAAGSRFDHVLKVTLHVADIALWDRVNAVYARVFGDHRPAPAVVPSRDLHFGFLVEVNAIAALAHA